MRPNSIFKLTLTVSVLCVGTSVGGSSTDRGYPGASDSLLVQLDWGPTSLVPLYQYATVPSFSLFADGLVIYHRMSREDKENAVLCLQLSSEEAEAIRRHV